MSEDTPRAADVENGELQGSAFVQQEVQPEAVAEASPSEEQVETPAEEVTSDNSTENSI